MSDYFAIGANDAQRATFYGDSLPVGTMHNSETRATYRAGWIANRAARGMENLPAYFAEVNGRYYWIVGVDHDKRPVYQVTNGNTPTGCGGYHNLRALMELKGDSFIDD